MAAVIIIVISSLGGGGGGGGGGGAGASKVKFIPTTAAPANIVAAIKGVTASELAAAGSGGSEVATIGPKGGPHTGLVKVDGPAVTSGGKPEVVYMGSEFCPYCAATRWPLAIALSKFGTFSGLKITASSPVDIFTNTHTLSFYKVKYSSRYLTFSETEQLTNKCPSGHVVANPSYTPSQPAWYNPKYACNTQETALQPTPKKVAALASTYDSAAWVGNQANGIPFIDFGGKYVESSSLYNPEVLHGLSWDQIAASFKHPTGQPGKEILATANRYIALICAMTNNHPGSVCNASYAKAAKAALGK